VRSRVLDAALEGATVLDQLLVAVGALEDAAVLASVVGGGADELALFAGHSAPVGRRSDLITRGG